jgi:hypothetical protein
LGTGMGANEANPAILSDGDVLDEPGSRANEAISLLEER